MTPLLVCVQLDLVEPYGTSVQGSYFSPVILIRKTHPWAFWMHISNCSSAVNFVF